MSDLAANLERIIELAVNDREREAIVRDTHRFALKRLQVPGAASHRDFALWKQQERNAWAIVQALNDRIMRDRWDVVDFDEEIDVLERRFAMWQKARESGGNAR